MTGLRFGTDDGKSDSKGKYAKAGLGLTMAFAATALTAGIYGCGGRTGLYPPEQNVCANDGGVQSDSGTKDSGPAPDGGNQKDGGVQNDGGIDSGPSQDGGVQPQPLWEGKNLIGDFLNRQLGDRLGDVNASDTSSAYSMNGPETSDDANPFSDGNGGTIGPSNVFMYKIGSDSMQAFASESLTDNSAAFEYTEKQAMWLAGDNHFDASKMDVVGQLGLYAYSMKFDGPGNGTAGIPVCTKALSGDYTACLGQNPGLTLDDATETHKLTVVLFGESWIVSKMTAPSGVSLNNESTLVNGGSIKLAKESVAGILNTGEMIPVDNIKFRLDDLVANGTTVSAIISILDTSNNVLMKDTVQDDSTKDYTINGKNYLFHVYKVAPGYTWGAKWADVAIFSKEIELRDGEQLDPESGNYPGYTVALGWKNNDTSSPQPDSLRSVVIYSDSIDQISSGGSTLLATGDYIPLGGDLTPWKLTYSGLDLQPADRAALKFAIQTTDLSLSAGENATGYPCTVFAPYIKVTSGATGGVFSAPNTQTQGDITDNEFIAPLLKGVTCYKSNSTLQLGGPIVVMKVSPGSSMYGIGVGMVGYSAIGDVTGSPINGMLLINQQGIPVDVMGSAGASCVTGNCVDLKGKLDGVPDTYFMVAEKAGEWASNGFASYFIFGIDGSGTGNPADATFSFDSNDGKGFSLTGQGKMLYGHAVANSSWYSGSIPSGPVASGMELIDPNYVSERGSSMNVVDPSTVQLTMAHKLAYAVWDITSSK